MMTQQNYSDAHLIEVHVYRDKGGVMDLMEHIRRPKVDGVQMQFLNSQSEPVEGGTMCVTPFHLIFSTRNQPEDELTVQ